MHTMCRHVQLGVLVIVLDACIITDGCLRMQTGATPDHRLLVWHVLVDVPTSV